MQVPAGEIGVVVAQVGRPLPIGAKSAVYEPEFGNFSNVRTFLDNGGQKGVQRPVLPPGTLVPIHPVAFLVHHRRARSTAAGVARTATASRADRWRAYAGIVRAHARAARVVVIAPERATRRGRHRHRARRRATAVGRHRESARRLRRHRRDGGHDGRRHDAEIIEVLLGNKNTLHNNYQDFQAFLDTAARSACSTIRCCTARTC